MGASRPRGRRRLARVVETASTRTRRAWDEEARDVLTAAVWAAPGTTEVVAEQGGEARDKSLLCFVGVKIFGFH